MEERGARPGPSIGKGSGSRNELFQPDALCALEP